MTQPLFARPYKFEWDKGNRDKNLHSHDVTNQECEEIFFDENKKILEDSLHSQAESRHILLGKTKLGRLLFAVFTLRGKKIRVISARDLNQKERSLYES